MAPPQLGVIAGTAMPVTHHTGSNVSNPIFLVVDDKDVGVRGLNVIRSLRFQHFDSGQTSHTTDCGPKSTRNYWVIIGLFFFEQQPFSIYTPSIATTKTAVYLTKEVVLLQWSF
jgi:hypothetical protein